jgi:hypothetical protein
LKREGETGWLDVCSCAIPELRPPKNSNIFSSLKSPAATALNRTPVSPPVDAGVATKLHWFAAITLTGWALLLQFIYATHAGPLWRDEASSVNFSAVPTVAEMWSNFRFDNFPPLFAFVLRWFIHAGFGSDMSFRLLGFAISILVLAAIWVAAWLITKRPPLLVLAVFALNPLAIRTDGAIRPYGLGYAFLLVTIALIYSYVRQPRRVVFVLASMAAVLSVQTLYQATFFIAAAILGMCALTILQKQYRLASVAILIGAIAACSLVVDLPHLMHDWGKTGWIGQSSFDISKIALDWSDVGSAFWRAAANEGAFAAMLCCGVLIAGVVVGLQRGFVRRDAVARVAIVALLCGTAVYLCFLRFSGLHAQSWYFLILLAVSALWVDAIAGALVEKTLRFSTIAMALLIMVASAVPAWNSVRTRATSLDIVAMELRAKAKPNDVILTMPWYYGITLGRYFDRNRFTTVPPLRDATMHRYDLVQQAMESPEPIAGLLHDIEQALRQGGTVWTIGEIILPGENEQVPILPPYRPGNGLRDEDYLTSWSMQIAVLLAKHVGKAEVIALPNLGPVNPLENPKVVACSGWRE